ncbi:deformed epidermal autoregulatory factor 1 homolog isoform X2 [Amphiura filiformis]|uniref:deformed epidermal autoregulatory factor 1 homolog isoform X2 n=1 Tax=Amphiura filiformis TaxID=82378 RepID=UPI003B210526
MENPEVTAEVAVSIAEAAGIVIAEDLPSAADDNTFVNAGSPDAPQITTSVADQVFTATPTAILTADGLPVSVQDATLPLKTTHQIVTIVHQEASHLVDGLKTPATPCTPITPGGERKAYTWDDTINMPILPVRCRNKSAELHKHRLGSGGKGRCVRFEGNWYTPSGFESLCGRGNSKDWKRSIRYGGRTLFCLIEEGILTPHAASCTCASCCDDESVVGSDSNVQSGPVRLFVPYKRRKRNESDSLPPTPTMKRKPKLKDAADETRSISLDSQNGHLTVTDGNLVLSPMPPTTPKATDFDQQHWWHLEEMALTLLQQVQQLKVMIDQTKAQAMASKDAAVAQAKIQFEAEKKEALSHARMEAQLQLSRAMMEARAEKDNAVAQAMAQARAEKVEAVANAKSAQLIKTCMNCGREALSECTGCHRVSYCSSFCQRKDWTSHQHACGHNHDNGIPSSPPIHHPVDEEEIEEEEEEEDPDKDKES